MNRKDVEKIWVVGYFPVRQHSRVLYIPLSVEVCRLHDIRKGDTVKAVLLSVLKAPRNEEKRKEEEFEKE